MKYYDTYVGAPDKPDHFYGVSLVIPGEELPGAVEVMAHMSGAGNPVVTALRDYLKRATDGDAVELDDEGARQVWNRVTEAASGAAIPDRLKGGVRPVPDHIRDLAATLCGMTGLTTSPDAESVSGMLDSGYTGSDARTPRSRNGSPWPLGVFARALFQRS
ncbi:MAG TPA: hypothetical protein VLF69_05015 [Candidatus Saccharimonadales bacterium]|nr:hypothetical protein [Candidatus Saccharimonadales bacterium]